MVNVSLDTLGRLIKFEAVPPQVDSVPSSEFQVPTKQNNGPIATESPNSESPNAKLETDMWSPLFEEAGLGLASFTPTQSQWLPVANSDARAAWEGKLPGQPEIPIRVEAASYHGKPIYFEIVGPWTRPERMQEFQGRSGIIVLIVVSVLLISFMIVGVWLTIKNLREGRGDRKGALRLAIYIFSALMISWVFLAHHYLYFGEFSLLLTAVSDNLFVSTLVWLFYMALEPYVRRWWPHRIVSWSRLLAGDFRNPLIGRDILIGSVFGVAITVVNHLAFIASGFLTGFVPAVAGNLSALLGLRESVGQFFNGPATFPVFVGLSYLFLLLLLYLFCARKEWLSSLMAWLLPTLLWGILSWRLHHGLGVLFFGLIFGLILAVTTRFGLLAMIASQFFTSLAGTYPMTWDFSVWYAGSTIFALSAGLAVALYSFYISLGGQPVFKRGLLRE
jgi:serine/threonine-protein kinase